MTVKAPRTRGAVAIIRTLVRKDFTVKGLADRLEVSESTLRRWMKKPPSKPLPEAVLQRLAIAEYGSRSSG